MMTKLTLALTLSLISAQATADHRLSPEQQRWHEQHQRQQQQAQYRQWLLLNSQAHQQTNRYTSELLRPQTTIHLRGQIPLNNNGRIVFDLPVVIGH